jgi:hypothetical protein
VHPALSLQDAMSARSCEPHGRRRRAALARRPLQSPAPRAVRSMFSEQPPAAPSLWPSLIGNGWVPSSARCTGRMDARSGEAEDRHPRLTPIGGERSNTPRVASVQAAWKPTPRCCTADSVGGPDPGAHPVELVYLRVTRGTSAAIRCWDGRARTRSRQSTDRSFARDCMEATAPVPARHARAHDVTGRRHSKGVAVKDTRFWERG